MTKNNNNGEEKKKKKETRPLGEEKSGRGVRTCEGKVTSTGALRYIPTVMQRGEVGGGLEKRSRRRSSKGEVGGRGGGVS